MTLLEAVVDTAPDWMVDAACSDADPDLFFAPRGVAEGRNTYVVARTYCDRCPVRTECLNYALVEGIGHGFWGGKSVRERRRIRHERRLA